jgi:hypothetical protein
LIRTSGGGIQSDAEGTTGGSIASTWTMIDQGVALPVSFLPVLTFFRMRRRGCFGAALSIRVTLGRFFDLHIESAPGVSSSPSKERANSPESDLVGKSAVQKLTNLGARRLAGSHGDGKGLNQFATPLQYTQVYESLPSVASS